MTTLSNEQFQQLLQTLAPNPNAQPPPAPAKNDPSALGPMPPCVLSADKMFRLSQFETWLEEAENRMKFIGIDDNEKKLSLLRSWGGSDFIGFMKTHVKIRFEEIPAEGTTAAIPADTYDEAVQKVKAELRKSVNRTMAMYQLFNTKQGERNWMDYVKVLEDKAHILDFNNTRYTHNDAVKHAAIFGMTDDRLQEKALSDDPTLEDLIRQGQSRESGKESVQQLNNKSTVARVTPEATTVDEIDEQIRSLQIMKIKKQGRYSSKPKRQPKEEIQEKPKLDCNTCSAKHPPGKCIAQGKECFTCGEFNHFSGSKACKKTPSRTVNRVTDDQTSTGSYSNTRMEWPGVKSEETKELRLITSIRKIGGMKKKKKKSKHVQVTIGTKPFSLFADTGSEYTIIPPSSYQESMGEVVAADTHLRAWGSETNLKVCGMVNSTITTKKGAKVDTKVYIVDGFHPEPLLGDADAEALGFITFNEEGRDPEPEDVNRIAQKIRENLGVTVNTSGAEEDEIPESEKRRVEELIHKYEGLVFSEEKIGRVDMKPIHLEVEPGFKPTQPQFHNTPIHYKEELSKHLQFLREEGAMTDIDPSESHAYDCVMNTVITDKKGGQIRMNLDTTPWNPGMRRTKFHVQTPQEIRHELKEAKIFTEMDMAWAYHQLPIDEETKERSIFQTHEGLHRMEVLYFGPTASCGIFHDAVRKKLTGLKGARNIYDNFIVWGRNYDEHYENLKACLERCAENGIILKSSKTNTCLNKIKWFGRTFTSEGVTADKDKINAISEEGRPENIEDVRSFLMACQYNAKFLFDSPDICESYEQVTSPLRALLKKDTKFVWGTEQEESYKKLITLMESPATLRPYKIGSQTHFISDSSEIGIQSSVYQVEEDGTWVPVDHTSRALTPTEADYSPIERESLAQSWGMDQFRFYLVGGSFTAWTDHEPLVGIYNKKGKKTSKRIGSHRDKICDLQYTMKHLSGDSMPCDYGSRHPFPTNQLPEHEQEKLGCDIGNEIYVRKINITNSPDAILPSDIRSAGTKDATYTHIMKEVSAGNQPSSKVPLGYKRVWDELSIIDGILHRGNKIVLPNGKPGVSSIGIRDMALDIAHEGHIGMSETKQFLRTKLWFPGMDERVNNLVSTCLPCLASTEVKHRDPLVPTIPPSEPWSKLDADHWGPTPDGKHILVVIDELTRFPEVAVVSSTSADANIEAFDDIFCRHGYPDDLKTDGGPPFNGGDSHLLKEYFKWAGIHHHPTISADDPEANGLAESVMKHLKKIWHTALVEKKNPHAEINKHLLKMRTTPHPTTKKSPAELLYHRHIRTRLPQVEGTIGERPDITEAITEDQKMKQKQKMYKDRKSYVKPHQIQVGDQVLLKQKTTKRTPPYDPKPYTVTSVRGHQIAACRGNQRRTRDAQKWKKVTIRTPTDYAHLREEERRKKLHNNDDVLDFFETGAVPLVESGQVNHEEINDIFVPEQWTWTSPRRSTRQTQKPDRLGISS